MLPSSYLTPYRNPSVYRAGHRSDRIDVSVKSEQPLHTSVPASVAYAAKITGDVIVRWRGCCIAAATQLLLDPLPRPERVSSRPQIRPH